jgi:hypothetical protein
MSEKIKGWDELDQIGAKHLRRWPSWALNEITVRNG